MIKGFIFLFVLIISPLSFAKGGFLPAAFKADFTQVVKSKVSNKEIKAPLKIKYAFPNKIHFEVTGKNAITYVCNSKKVWIYNPPFIEGMKGTLKVGSSGNFCYSKMFDVLSKGMKTNKLYSVKKETARHYLVSFSKKTASNIGYKSIELFFDKSKRHNLESVESLSLVPLEGSDPVKLVRNKFTKVQAFKSGTFSFKTPENTDVSALK